MRPEKQTLEDARSGGRTLLTLVIPTRNEVDNVPRLVRELRESLTGVDYRVVFVDDSTDRTPQVIRSTSEEDGRIFLIHREEAEQGGGLSTAVITGMDAIADESEYICVMDADLQHPPKKVREMLDKARESRADVVVASRYAQGGSYTGLPGHTRKAVSVGSKCLAQIVFKEARKTSDPLAGFFLEVLVCAPELKVIEVPLNFRSRNAGASKASLRQGLMYLSHIASLFWYVPSAGRFWKFALVGASGVLVNMLTLITLVEHLDVNPTLAWMAAVGVSILSNFLLNNAFTWRDIRHSSRIHFLLRGALAYPVAILALATNFAVFYPTKDAFGFVLGEYSYVLANFLGIVAGTSANFILSSRLVFRPPSPQSLDPTASPREIADQARRELKADWVGLIRAEDLSPIAGSRGVTGGPHPLTTADKSTLEIVLNTSQPTLVITGPRRLPQARTNTRWMSSLVVPVLNGERPVGFAVATRNSTEQFTEEDLHWLTAYASDSNRIFY